MRYYCINFRGIYETSGPDTSISWSALPLFIGWKASTDWPSLAGCTGLAPMGSRRGKQMVLRCCLVWTFWRNQLIVLTNFFGWRFVGQSHNRSHQLIRTHAIWLPLHNETLSSPIPLRRLHVSLLSEHAPCFNKQPASQTNPAFCCTGRSHRLLIALQLRFPLPKRNTIYVCFKSKQMKQNGLLSRF